MPKFKYRNANNVEGILLSPFNGGPAIFRIYGKNGEFKDYKIRHDDVRVKILDDSVELLESEDGKQNTINLIVHKDKPKHFVEAILKFSLRVNFCYQTAPTALRIGT